MFIDSCGAACSSSFRSARRFSDCRVLVSASRNESSVGNVQPGIVHMACHNIRTRITDCANEKTIESFACNALRLLDSGDGSEFASRVDDTRLANRIRAGLRIRGEFRQTARLPRRDSGLNRTLKIVGRDTHPAPIVQFAGVAESLQKKSEKVAIPRKLKANPGRNLVLSMDSQVRRPPGSELMPKTMRKP